jgi:lipoyl(octanoyl) transferase
VYPVLALDRFSLDVQGYLDLLHRVLLEVAADFTVQAETRPDHGGLWAGPSLLAGVGIAVRDWVSYYGAALNINPALHPYRLVRCGDGADGGMTSLERERRAPVRPALVRQRVVEHFTARLPFARVAVFSDHPSLGRKAPSDAVASRS